MAAGKDGSIAARLTSQEFGALVSALAARGRVVAPKRSAARGRFSDTDLIRYDEVSSAGDVEFRAKSDFSPKEVLFPVTQTLLVFDGQQAVEPAEDERPIYLFLRACDIHGIDRLDGIFLHNGPEGDPYYLRRRRRVRFILMECAQSFENCFCAAMGTNRADEYAMAIRWAEDGVQVLVRDAEIGRGRYPESRDQVTPILQKETCKRSPRTKHRRNPPGETPD
ncbi:MAG: hypothetical protein GX591_11760 [Planctomycetes bacterium]|nr:hypothetical protein [Planctomycetota bacterium]